MANDPFDAMLATAKAASDQNIAFYTDHLNGLVVRRGAVLGVPTPLNQAMWAMVKLLESPSGG